MSEAIAVSEEARPYLIAQRGSIDLLRGDPDVWLRAYRAGLQADFDGIRAHLPARCGAILDIGSGLGGIDIMLSRHYGGEPEICLLDGEADEPKMRLHRETFNDMAVARKFLAANGVGKVETRSPPQIGEPRRYDLVLSLGSWCFHYEPAVYLDFVLACSHPHTVVIVDCRATHADWRHYLLRRLRRTRIIQTTSKYDRMVFQVR